MERWTGRVAAVTGSSAGIGEAITKNLVKSGMIVIGLARRVERIEELRDTLPKSMQINLHPRKCDISNEDDVNSTFKWIEETFGQIDVLVNNAAIIKNTSLIQEGNEQQLKDTLQTNLWGLILCTKRATEIMKRKHISDGHFININSVSGHKINFIPGYGSLNVYASTKYAITALTEVLRQEFIQAGTKIKITSISPGAVATEMTDSETARKTFENILDLEDISNAILYVLGTPEHVQVHELIIKPVGEKF